MFSLVNSLLSPIALSYRKIIRATYGVGVLILRSPNDIVNSPAYAGQ